MEWENVNIVGNVAGAGRDQLEIHGVVLTVVLPPAGQEAKLPDRVEAGMKEKAGLTEAEHQHRWVPPSVPSPPPLCQSRTRGPRVLRLQSASRGASSQAQAVQRWLLALRLPCCHKAILYPN